MFKSGDIVKVIIPGVPNDGYDYRLTGDAPAGAFVRVTLMNRPIVGVISGVGDSNIAPEKIKSATPNTEYRIPNTDLEWLKKMSEWTMMPMGMALRLIINVPDVFAPPKQENLYSYNGCGRMTDTRQAVADAFASNDNEPMSINDIQNIAHVSSAVINTMIKKEILIPAGARTTNHKPQTTNYFDTKKITLNDEQQSAADEIAKFIPCDQPSSPLAEGWREAPGCRPSELPANPKLKERARELRKAGSLPEALLWREISGKKINGLNFDRQKIIGNYIVDFFCPTNMTVIEIDDAMTHDWKGEYDVKRDEYLRSLGLNIIRFTAKEILKRMNDVIASLLRHPGLRPPLCQRETSSFKVFLLDGITGSGKTQVYFDAAWRTYASGKSVLLMMPEIALTAQFMTRFADRFGAPPVVWHSNLTAAKRRDIWRGVARGEIRMVVGTRSALFLPWQNLGLVVVDEEHDGSYKQEDQGTYNARDMAILRAAISNFPIILASATPSFETIKNVTDGKYKHLKLTSRFGGASMPRIETIDMRNEKSGDLRVESRDNNADNNLKSQLSNLNSLSPTLCKAIRETLDAKQQIMLFINRRGFAPIVQCKNCGWVATCPDCSCGMVYHKGKINQQSAISNHKLLCHVCGRTTALPQKCPDCGGDISMRGAGLEKIEEEVNAKFPTAKTALVSSDTMMSRQALERLVRRMENGEIDIVIGTQILAKGHHFPNLTLVGVVDADMGLFGADFRSGEHTFQQLFQVAGRAGRGEIPGRVLMQTYQPEHPVLRAICEGRRDEFTATDMTSRRIAKMPPYGRMIAIIVEGQKEKALLDFCKKLSDLSPKITNHESRILGPIPAPMYQIRQWYRMRFLITGDERADLQSVVRQWLPRVKIPANIRVKIDVAPINFN